LNGELAGIVCNAGFQNVGAHRLASEYSLMPILKSDRFGAG
jgi:hypothetical protein